jgi:5-deoxy-glucuronate isomerase
VTLHLPADGQPLVVTPESAGWQFSGLRVLELSPGIAQTMPTGSAELFVLPLAGALSVQVASLSGAAEASFELAGRTSVFTAVTDFAYVGRDSVLTVVSPAGARVALPSARCANRLPAAYGPASGVPIEVRGAGPATRQVTNFGVPGAWEHADKLVCCEVITPPGNWSSYPPHKHDVTEPCQVVNEEIYYYRIAGRDQVTPSRAGFGLHRTYTGPEHTAAGLGGLDESLEVHDGDVVLIPYGYHGPCVAAPGYPMYYLNVLAGPGETRSTAFCDDPAHAWVRDTWSGLPTDPRCPVTSAAGPVGAA